MTLSWTRESAPRWDADKQRIIGDAPAGIFDLRAPAEGDVVPGEWWRVDQDGAVVGYGWMDVVWGDGEILLAADPAHHGRGIGGFILDRLEDEARQRGLKYIFNSVRPDHPRRDEVTLWLQGHGFAATNHGARLQRQVG